ncbi:hypothetical protein IWQ62_000166 [Dispira parvispora]|uniref:Tyrosinase copper-binding domain-containing protein n=1 Tax=Dispira parvispora TaxID=1520584 RepID=A0A9W8B1Y4_9FUNG|nr:hypothetical protein IWQ62_000166 [Dispira parvispora]
MKLTLLTLAVACLAVRSAADDDTVDLGGHRHRCNSIHMRKEWRQMTPDEQSKYVSAVKELNNGDKPSKYDEFTKLHVDNGNSTHTWPVFLPFHRLFIRKFEEQLQRIDPSVVLAYWDWSIDSADPSSSPIWETYGGTGTGDDQCMTEGEFANWQVYYGVNGTEPHCLRRSFNRGTTLGPLFPPEYLEQTSRDTNNYTEWWDTLERSPHAIVHGFMGGDMLDMGSPNDPVFWLHHTFLDKLWSEWQDKNSVTDRAYSGNNIDGTPALLTDEIPGYPGTTVADVFDTTSRLLCYEYSDSSNLQGTGIATEIPVAPATPGANTRRSLSARDAKYTGDTPSLGQEPTFIHKIGGSNYHRTWNLIYHNDKKWATDLDARKLCNPDPIPADFINSMGYNEDHVRNDEAKAALQVTRFNVFFEKVCTTYDIPW